MPNVEVRGRYRAFIYDGTTPLDFTTYANSLCVIRRPNEISFVTLRQYIPGISTPFTTFEPGSSYVIVSREGNANFDMGPYARVDRLPSSLNVRSPQYYLGLDKNSITIPLSVYSLSVNNPLSSVTGITYINGVGASQSTVTTDQIRNGFQTSFTHFMPNSGYQLRNRVPYTFFAPLQSEMGDWWSFGKNTGGEYGMGYRYSNNSFPGDTVFGTWDKIVFNNLSYNCSDDNQIISAPSIAALSSCGTSKALFVLGNNVNGQLGTNSTKQYYATWTRVPGEWTDVAMGRYHMLAINSQGHLYSCGDNTFGQLGLGSVVSNIKVLTFVDNTRTYVQVAATGLGTMVRDSNGFLYACGNNREGKLGVGNSNAIIYTLTQEALGYTWISVNAGRPVVSSSDPSTDYFVAIRSNNTLYGVGTALTNSYFGSSNTNNIPYTFKQESLNFTDVTSVITTINGTFIQRRNQSNYFAAGNNSSGNPLAIINNNTSITFLETYIPSDAIAIANYYNLTTTGIGTSYIRNSIRYSKTTGNSFTPDTNNYNNIFTDASTTFIRRGLQPTPTPSVTPTVTPTPTPTATPAPAGRWMFVPGTNAAGATTNVIYFSNDAITWTPRTISITDTLQGAAYDAANNRIIINSFSQTSISTDGGATWSTGGSLIGTNYNRRMVYANGVYSGVGGTSTVGPVGYCSTNNGASWFATTLPFPGSTSRQWNSVTFGQGKFVAVSAGRAAGRTNVGAYSTDGINWTASTMPFFEWYIQTRYANNRFIATSYTVNPGGNGISYSSDGINWAASTRPSTTDFALPRGIAFNRANNRWIVTDSAMKAAYSDNNGATFNLIPGGTITNLFTASTDSITSGQGKFVIMTASNTAGYTANNQILISQDGLSWTYYPANFRTGTGSLYFLNN